jgi:hypothetical protein
MSMSHLFWKKVGTKILPNIFSWFFNQNIFQVIAHTDVDFEMWKTVVIRIHLPQKWNVLSFIQNLSIFIPKSLWYFCQPKNSPQNQRTYISVFELFHIKFMFFSFSLCCNHFTSLAYEIFYARTVDLFDKYKRSFYFPTFFVCEWRIKNFNRILIRPKSAHKHRAKHRATYVSIEDQRCVPIKSDKIRQKSHAHQNVFSQEFPPPVDCKKMCITICCLPHNCGV